MWCELVHSSYGLCAETTVHTVQKAARLVTHLAADRWLRCPIPEHRFYLFIFNFR